MDSQQTTHVPNDSNVFPRPLACESNGNSGSPPPGEVGAGGAASATPDTGCAIAAEAEDARPPERRAAAAASPAAAVPTAATAKKTPKYQIRHQSLTPSAEDSRQFCVDKDQLGR